MEDAQILPGPSLDGEAGRTACLSTPNTGLPKVSATVPCSSCAYADLIGCQSLRKEVCGRVYDTTGAFGGKPRAISAQT